jgi:hypothetical protein
MGICKDILSFQLEQNRGMANPSEGRFFVVGSEKFSVILGQRKIIILWPGDILSESIPSPFQEVKKPGVISNIYIAKAIFCVMRLALLGLRGGTSQ